MATPNYAVYEAWEKTTLEIVDRCNGFPKSVRFTFSNRMINLALDTLEQIIEAIYQKQRANILRQINLNLEKMRLLCRLCEKKGLLSPKQYEHLVKAINHTGKMIGGWLKSIAK